VADVRGALARQGMTEAASSGVTRSSSPTAGRRIGRIRPSTRPASRVLASRWRAGSSIAARRWWAATRLGWEVTPNPDPEADLPGAPGAAHEAGDLEPGERCTSKNCSPSARTSSSSSSHPCGSRARPGRREADRGPVATPHVCSLRDDWGEPAQRGEGVSSAAMTSANLSLRLRMALISARPTQRPMAASSGRLGQLLHPRHSSRSTRSSGAPCRCRA